MGAFQELPQVELARPYCKFAARPSSIEQVPFILAKAFAIAVAGRPGACYVDLPANFITGEVSSDIKWYGPVPLPAPVWPDELRVKHALELLYQAKRPLLILGKGASYAYNKYPSDTRFNHKSLTGLVEKLNIPFLPTPMAKGLVSDTHRLCVNSARSMALKQADFVLVLGARLNWILHFGVHGPRFSNTDKNGNQVDGEGMGKPVVISVDIAAEEVGVGLGSKEDTALMKPTHHSLVCDIPCFVHHLLNTHVTRQLKPLNISSWLQQLDRKKAHNVQATQQLVANPSVPMTYYSALGILAAHLEKHPFVLVNEGANTMDIARTLIQHSEPRLRLDAGSFGTMGLGLGYAMAAQIHQFQSAHETERQRWVVCVQGDSAFGFGLAEIETAVRYKLPLLMVVINNGGIYSGLPMPDDAASKREDDVYGQLVGECMERRAVQTGETRRVVPDLPSTALLPASQLHYHRLVQMFTDTESVLGQRATTPAELNEALERVFSQGHQSRVNLVEVVIDSQSARKTQEYSWMTTKSAPSKL